MMARISALVRPVALPAPRFTEGAGYLLAAVVVGTELLARLVILH